MLSGRRELNPLPSPWQGDILPMNYSRSSLQFYPPPTIKSTENRRLPQRLSLCESRSDSEILPVARSQFSPPAWGKRAGQGVWGPPRRVVASHFLAPPGGF